MQDNIIETRTEAPKRFQCRHIFTDGHRCGSACLHHQEFCYYHHTTRKPVANPRQRRSRRAIFDLPLPEDRSAIQASIGEVLQRIASNDIDPRRAGLLLYGLQIASLNLPKPQRETATAVPETVEEITTDPELGTLAPRTEVGAPEERRSVVADMIMSLLQNEEANKQTQETNILPTLNAEAASFLTTRRQTVRRQPTPHKAGCNSSRHQANPGRQSQDSSSTAILSPPMATATKPTRAPSVAGATTALVLLTALNFVNYIDRACSLLIGASPSSAPAPCSHSQYRPSLDHEVVAIDI